MRGMMKNQIDNEEKLEELLSRPSEETIDLMRKLDGDMIFLGIAGKIGPSLARMAFRACRAAGVKKRIFGVSRFGNKEEKSKIESSGIETIPGDLLDRNFLLSLPKPANLFFLAGMKFGSGENPGLTWAINTYLPALVAEHFKDSRIVAYSTGCVYPLVHLETGGSTESDTPGPVGEYAQSCLGRERMFQFGSDLYKTAVALIRLNYAVETRYGVLLDIGLKVKNNLPVDLTMGSCNVIWQGDANNMVLRAAGYCAAPPFILNVTGPEILSVREVALEFGKLMGKEVRFTSQEASTALLSNASKAFTLFGKPEVPAEKLIQWIAHWLKKDGRVLGKPTHFEVRDGKF